MTPPHDLLLFDLDGTLSDPVEGITRSFNFALTQRGHAPRQRNELARYIGPPLDHAFASIIDTNDQAEITALVAKYRERYGEVGFSENVLYPDVQDLLARLADAGVPMAVCTSKREDFATRILQMFGILEYFRFVCGGDVGVEKWQQIASLQQDGAVTSASVMIGDRAVDIVAAHRNGMEAAGVLWGYGSRAELESEAPRYLFTEPAALVQLTPAGVR